MTSTIFSRLLGSSATLALLVSSAVLAASSAQAQQVAANDSGLETVVVTGTAFNPDVAPAKARLETTEPQTIINQSYIQDSVADTADYTTILAIAPSMSGQDVNGPGLSDGGAKNTLRGQADGNFVMQYDGIPFGDTNGPSHHSESYFPGVTIGSIDVDRGPGNAGNMGAATFGGTVKLFSENLNTDTSTRISATAANWGTNSENLNFQSGDLDVGGMPTRVLVNLNYTGSSGYLTYETTSRQNILLKTQTTLAPGWTLTAFANYNGLWQNLNDNAGSTPAQIFTFGKNFGLQITNPKLGTYQAYSPEGKKTDMDYLRLQGDMGSFNIDDTAYTYAYVNKTVSSTNPEQTAADITKGVTEGLGTTLNGVKIAADVPGYTKQNAYRVWGNIFRAAEDFDYGWLTGQLRAGIWSEWSATQRQRKDLDLTACYANGCDPWHTTLYSDSSLTAKTTSAFYHDGFYEYVEHSNWSQYQPYVELELHPLDGLTVTPGFKYIDWNRSVAAPLEQKSVPVISQFESFTTTRSLPFLTANYKLEQSWSVYAQYAQGIYIPDISAFEQGTLLATAPKAETTANYQVGTVYYADNFSFDGDLYYMGVNNNISYSPCTGNTSETCAINTGTAVYKGIEGQGTYAFDGVLSGLSFFASGSLNNAKTAGAVVKTAPLWTEADGLIYKTADYKLSLIDKLVGQQYVGKQSLNATLTPFYKLPAYNNMDFKADWTLGAFDIGFGIYNLLNSRNLLAITVNDKTLTGGANVFDLSHRGNSLDQYFYAPSRSFQISVAAHL